MRFKIRTDVCVEVESIEQLNLLEDRATVAVGEAVSEWHIEDPEHGSVSGGSVEGLDMESRAALEREA